MAIDAKCAALSFAVFFPAGNLEGSPKDSLTEFADYFQQPNFLAAFGSASRALRSVCVRRVVRSDVYPKAGLSPKCWETVVGVPT